MNVAVRAAAISTSTLTATQIARNNYPKDTTHVSVSIPIEKDEMMETANNVMWSVFIIAMLLMLFIIIRSKM